MSLLPSVSLVVPLYNEVANLSRLLAELAKIRDHFQGFEVQLIDDNSQDGSAALFTLLQQQYPWLHVHIRQAAARDLSQSVLIGLTKATQTIIVIMDGDLSHNPQDVMKLVRALLNTPADCAIGSRFIAGGDIANDWPWFRRLNALVAKRLTKGLTPLTDPLSGFLAIRRSALPALSTLSPIGYKIGLELLVKTPHLRVVEVPIHFAQRKAGVSKLNWKEQRKFLQHLLRLRRYLNVQGVSKA